MIIAGRIQGQPPFVIATKGMSGLEGLGAFDIGAFIQSIVTPAFDLTKTILAPPTMQIKNADGSTQTIRTPQPVQTGAGPTNAQAVGQAASNVAATAFTPTNILIGGGILLAAIMMMNQGRR